MQKFKSASFQPNKICALDFTHKFLFLTSNRIVLVKTQVKKTSKMIL